MSPSKKSVNQKVSLPASILEPELGSNSALHDVITIGGSSGCFGVLRDILRSLPRDFPAAVLVVAHLGPSVSLVSILQGCSSLPMKLAVSGQALQRGHVYLAVADAHLLVHDHHILVRRGPRENLARPAIDPLFRSAACAFGSRVIGVVLSGALNDGSAGLAAIEACGGLTIVQDPEDADVRSMPDSALQAATIDHCVPGRDIGNLLNQLVREPPAMTPPIPTQLKLEVAIAAQEAGGMDIEERLGQKSPFTCPDCDGVLWQMHDDRVLRFRCHVGHAVTAEAMLQQKSESADAILWRLLRTHEERAALARRLAAQQTGPNKDAQGRALAQRAAGYEEDAMVVRGLLGKVAELNDWDPQKGPN